MYDDAKARIATTEMTRIRVSFFLGSFRIRSVISFAKFLSPNWPIHEKTGNPKAISEYYLQKSGL